MWYGEGRELRVGWWAGLAFRRRFSRISWTSSSTASTSLACLLGIVGLLLPLLLPRISATTTGGCTSCSLCSIIATLTRTRASGTNRNHFYRNFPNSARNGGSSCAVYRYGTIHHNHTRARSTSNGGCFASSSSSPGLIHQSLVKGELPYRLASLTLRFTLLFAFATPTHDFVVGVCSELCFVLSSTLLSVGDDTSCNQFASDLQ